MAENPLLYTYFTSLSSVGPGLVRIKALHCGTGKFAFFCVKNCQNIKIFRSNRNIDASEAETHFLARYRLL